MGEREFRVFVHEEDGSYWAEVDGLPGCFASGDDLEELRAAVVEAIALYLEDAEAHTSPTARSIPRSRVDEMRVLVSA
jgi:predicted RNase H-like HicB family nuclease